MSGSPAPGASLRRPRLVVANWKMNKTRREAGDYLDSLLAAVSRGELDGAPEEGGRHASVTPARAGIAPPFTLLETVGRGLGPTPVLLCAQNVSAEGKGAFTGEVSAAMLADLGVKLCLVGHSERRRDFGEGEALLGRKMQRLAETAVAPLYCVGETLEERDDGRTDDVLRRQLQAFDPFGRTPPPGLVVAYEPVWAIGTGRAATAAMAAAAHETIRSGLAERFGPEMAATTPILYGGSVTPENAATLFAEEELDGGLVGGASLEWAGFAKILDSARHRA